MYMLQRYNRTDTQIQGNLSTMWDNTCDLHHSYNCFNVLTHHNLQDISHCTLGAEVNVSEGTALLSLGWYNYHSQQHKQRQMYTFIAQLSAECFQMS